MKDSYPSMASCAADSGVPKTIIQTAKRDGCPAIDQAGRVHLKELLTWIFARADGDGEGGTDWAGRLKRAQALKAELDLEESKGALVSKSDIIQEAQTVAARVRSVLEAKLLVDLPARLSGRPADEIERAMSKAFDAACAELSEIGK